MCTSESRIESPLSKLKENPHPVKIEVTEKTPIGVILVVTLIRTETTLDHSQKAEKVCPFLFIRMNKNKSEHSPALVHLAIIWMTAVPCAMVGGGRSFRYTRIPAETTCSEETTGWLGR